MNGYQQRCYHPSGGRVLGLLRAHQGTVLGRGMTTGEIARAMQCRASQLGPILLQLEAAGLIRRSARAGWEIDPDPPPTGCECGAEKRPDQPRCDRCEWELDSNRGPQE